MIRVIIVHENPVFRRGLCSLLQQTADIQIVGEAVQWEQVLTLTQAMLPDVVLFDGTLTANLPEHSAVELAVRICRTGVRGLFVFAPAGSAVEEPFLFRFLRCGAMACELPSLPEEELIEKIRRVADGNCLISSTLLLAQIRQLQRPPLETKETSLAQDEQKDTCLISEREITILKQVLKGYSNKQIAQLLQISDQTVKNHITSILKKFGVRDRTAAVVTALLSGVISLEDAHGQLAAKVVRVQKGVEQEVSTLHAASPSNVLAAQA